ncbi:ATP-binding protein [Bacillus sp. 31A1R]|uniref:histidine kinase n=1 Tax=Robertmurraya mangrovi TaxID=3098077 RepID=A0ABU5IVZ2_9BACI|nr:ATP-binding protein [Bacillus sp. 31A1R]MDZ5471333.1 ATP-binding protein [Bacillus sp. 31A1R]
MIHSLVRNREIRLLSVSIVTITVFFAFIVSIYTSSVIRGVHSEWEARNVAILGVVFEQHPELEETLMPLYTKNISVEEMQDGRESVKKYGLTDPISHINKPFLEEAMLKINIGLAILICFFLTIILSVSIGIFHRVYSQIRALSYKVEKIMRGDYNISNMIKEEEGDFPLLHFQFHQMSQRLKNTIDLLGQEKILLKNLIQDISHQLKTPLSSSMMFHDLIINELSSLEETDFLIKSRTQLERIHWLIQELLKFSKLESGLVQLEKRVLNINRTILEVISSLDYKIQAKGMKIHYESRAEEVWINHDERWLGEAIKNIVNNAIDYSPSHSDIYINLVCTSYYLSISIKDQGMGITKEELPNIFDRFYQARNNKARGDGTGIGLSLSKLIVSMHGGRMEVESVGLNKGSTFTITLFHDR